MPCNDPNGRKSKKGGVCICWVPRWLSGKGSARKCRRVKRLGFTSWVRKIPWRRKWQPTPVFLPGKSHGQRSLIGYSPWGHKQSDTTERLHFHFLPFVFRYFLCQRNRHTAVVPKKNRTFFKQLHLWFVCFFAFCQFTLMIPWGDQRLQRGVFLTITAVIG